MKFIMYRNKIKTFLKEIYYKYKYRDSTLSGLNVINSSAVITNSTFKERSRVGAYSKIVKSDIGKCTSIGPRCTIINVEIGSFCSISWNVTINARNHDVDFASTSAFPYVKRFGYVEFDSINHSTAKIGHDVWIGTGAVLLEGIHIGNGAVVAAGSVVTKNVPPYAIVAGVPAKIIRYRFSEELINKITQSEWWLWSDDKLLDNIDMFKNKYSGQF